MRKPFTLTICIAGILLMNLFSADMLLAETKGKAGTGKLSGLWANVYVGGLTYEPFFGWTQSDHWFEVINMTGRRVSFNYEFQHGVWEILKKNERGIVTRSRFVDNSVQQFARSVGPPTWYDELDGTQGVNCNGQPEGLYWIKAYTAIRTSVLGGSLAVQADEETEFWIFEGD